jgi:hypothetical protein
MSSNWGYVIAGYTISAATLGGYFAWVRVRTRRLRRSLGEDSPRP